MPFSRSQSALNAADGSSAAVLDQLGTVLYVGAGAIFAVVICLAVFAVVCRARSIHADRWVISGGPFEERQELLRGRLATDSVLFSQNLDRQQAKVTWTADGVSGKGCRKLRLRTQCGFEARADRHPTPVQGLFAGPHRFHWLSNTSFASGPSMHGPLRRVLSHGMGRQQREKR